MTRRARAVVVAATAVAALLELGLHRPAGLGDDPTDPTGAIVGAATWVIWALVGYLLLAVAITACGHLGGSTRTTASPAPRWAPRIVRRFVDAAVGATTAAVVVMSGAPVASYADAPPAPLPAGSTATATTLDWPGLVSSPARRQGRTGEEIVVRPGDSLWTLTARRLGPGASGAQVAAAWPRLYAANRAAIGADPNLIHPGQRLVPPAPDTRRPR